MEPPEERTESRLVSFQYVHVQLQGGAPWGFTLKGGLEHGEPLIVSKVEDGGKAALSRKMRPGDELVNINGTPLYGSRQEALVLIKGSYRTLKMIVRRRNVPVIRPHSWHLAKLSEVRTEAATMYCPSDAFSLSWHSGCDSSDLSLQWAQLSRHCSTEKSSSIGSMESLDPPGQTYYEGSLSPVDQSMYQNKRDSAYSSFSASSNASDYALSLRPEETSSTDSILQGLGPSRAHEGRYLQTGSEGADVTHQLCGHLAPNSRPSSCPHESNLSSSTKSGTPPQPPVRRDSLRASNPQPAGTERRRASAPADALYFPGRWTSDTSLCLRDKESEGVGGHPKEHLSADQYYMLSSHLDRRQPSMEPLLGESTDHPQGAAQGQCQDNGAHEGQPGTNVDPPQSPRKGHRHSAPEQLLASQLRSLNVATGSSRWDTQLQDRHQWTVNPLHLEQPGLSQQTEDAKEQPCGDPATGTDPADDHATQAQHSPGQAQDSCYSQEPYRCYPELERACSTPSKSAMPPQPASLTPTCSSKALVEEGKESGQSRPSARKSGPSHQRSAQLRRRSERFATNLRNEIQRRKAQLQKSKGSVALLCGEEPVEETDEPCESHPNPSAPPQGRLPSSGDRSSVSMAQARAKCLSPTPDTAPAGEHGRSPGRPANRSAPTPQPARKGPSTPAPDREKQRAPGTGGRWRWSPEHKLQRALSPGEAYAKGPEAPASPLRLAEDAVLLPFADRRKFFEETSRCVAHLPARHSKPPSFRPKAAESHAFQPLGTECRELRRCSVDQSYPPLSPGRQNLPTYAECCLEPPVCYAGLPRHGEFEYLRPFARACAGTAPVLHEPCLYCSGNMCPALLQRNMQPSHHGYRCHPHPWVPRCSDCCCSVPHKALEETEPWPGRKAFLPEFPLEEWEPGVINRKGSQSVSELAHYEIGFQREGPFQPCLESSEQTWPPCYRAASSLDLSWDCERHASESPSEPLRRPLRGRAFSESHLNMEPPSTQGQEMRDALLAKLDEIHPMPPCLARKKGPPPPRPPPPNWEKYRTRQASHHHLYPLEPTGPGSALLAVPLEQPHLQGGGSMETARQRSQSLPLDKLPGDSVKPVAISQSRMPGNLPQESLDTGHLPEQGSNHYYCHVSPREPLALDMGTRDIPRPDGLSEVGVKETPRWDTGRSVKDEQYQVISWGQERPRPSPPCLAPEEVESAQESAEVESCRLGRQPPCRMTSEELMRDVAGRDRSLAGVLSPASSMVTAAEVMGELFSAGDCHSWKDHYQQDWRLEKQSEVEAQEREEFQPISPPLGGAVSPTSYSAYYNTSAGKAELLNKMKELPEGTSEEEEVDHELAQKKAQLIESISRKLAVLQEAQRGLQEDINANAALGEEVECQVKGVCKPNEFDKFRLFIGDLDKVVNLLLSLSGRLARVENALNSLDHEATEDEKLALLEKKRQLTEQLEDAKDLKEHVDRRERAVFGTISHSLPAEQLQDYQHFVKMKSALIIEQRELEEKIKLGEEQLRCLRESLLLGPRDY
ncbi:protein Shroom4 isoform X1 [Mauremys reevesii]|uniref:protein Shroom4 isoform X1 n=2 Tax=Mauremys reevesii TaxID=260615 RepID=UPI00193F99A9|nr:protein Shroom4 isoform X1 [Mauremys reevesii]